MHSRKCCFAHCSMRNSKKTPIQVQPIPMQLNHCWYAPDDLRPWVCFLVTLCSFQLNQGFIHLAKSCKQSRSLQHNVLVLSLIRRMDKCITPLMLECICSRLHDFIYLVQSAAESVSLSQNPRHPAVVSLTPHHL